MLHSLHPGQSTKAQLARALENKPASALKGAISNRWDLADTGSSPGGMPFYENYLKECLVKISQLPEHVVRRFPRLDPGHHKFLQNVIILVTPAFAKWVEADGVFLEAALQHMYGNFTSYSSMRGLQSSVAIVDRLPGQAFQGDRTDAITSNATARAIDGHEGIALWIDSMRIDPDLVTSADDDDSGQRLVRMTLMRPMEGWSSVTVIELRPSNTLFVNGSQSTMFQDSWAINQSEGTKWRRTGPRALLKTLEFFVPADAPVFSAPIETLTNRREILSSMGNVIRQLKSANDGRPLPASAELEEKVPQYLARKRDTDGTLLVFALVTRARITETLGLDGILQPSEANVIEADMSSLRRALLAGAHLHRVTSGGGGWGKKQGLLSLDPAFDFAKHDDTGSLDAMLQGENPGSGVSAMNAVNPGDFVQFFASYEPEQQMLRNLDSASTTDVDTSDWDGMDWMQQTPLHTIAGSLPNQDGLSMPLQEGKQSQSIIIGIPDQFGMLSAGGTCLRRCKIEGGLRQPDTDANTGEGFQKEVKQLSVSRMDIPYGFWKAQSGNRPSMRRIPGAKFRRVPVLTFAKNSLSIHPSSPQNSAA